MFSKFPGRYSPGALKRRGALRLRAFAVSQSGAVAVDFVPLAAAVIGLAFGVVAVTTAALDSSSDEIASTMGQLEIQTRLPGKTGLAIPNAADRPSGEGVQTAEIPQNDGVPGSFTGRGTPSESGTSGGASGGTRYTEIIRTGVAISVESLDSEADSSEADPQNVRDDEAVTDQWFLPG
ncbi:MAG: hypothetical protein AAGA38_05195 [Pseudomonadota bacterium]